MKEGRSNDASINRQFIHTIYKEIRIKAKHDNKKIMKNRINMKIWLQQNLEII